jgi:hypothetical protein
LKIKKPISLLLGKIGYHSSALEPDLFCHSVSHDSYPIWN